MYQELKNRHHCLTITYRETWKNTSELAAELEKVQADLEETEKDAAELSDMVKKKTEETKQKDKLIKQLRAKIAELERQDPVPDEELKVNQTLTCRDLTLTHERYGKVLNVLKNEKCSLTNALRLSN